MYMPIITALKKGLIKPDEFIAYEPDKERRIYIRSDILNKAEKQTEFNLGWHAVIYKDFGVLLVADKVTKATLSVSEDCKINLDTLERFANLYKNKSLQATGIVPTAKLIGEIPHRLVRDNIMVYSAKQKNLKRGYKNVQPMLFIPPDTIVKIEQQAGKSKENGFKLYPRSSFETCKESKTMWVPLIEAIQAQIISVADLIEYIPDKAEVSFSPEETNTNEWQITETEYNLGGWHPILLKQDNEYQPYLIATNSSKFELKIFPETKVYNTLRIIGQNQYENGVKLLERYAKIYDNKRLTAKAIPINDKIFDTLDEKLTTSKEYYYLAATFSHKQRLKINDGKYYEEIMGLEWASDQGRLYGRPFSKLPIRIAIKLPKDIMVQINEPQYDGSIEEKAIKLKLSKQ